MQLLVISCVYRQQGRFSILDLLPKISQKRYIALVNTKLSSKGKASDGDCELSLNFLTRCVRINLDIFRRLVHVAHVAHRAS